MPIIRREAARIEEKEGKVQQEREEQERGEERAIARCENSIPERATTFAADIPAGIPVWLSWTSSSISMFLPTGSCVSEGEHRSNPEVECPSTTKAFMYLA
ncbi:hypothetical protein K3495_g10146 [Podosphaera aphanis]|nr:hypothetical protein K3495_g10146 [Podosphaera aphanis]